MILRRIIIYKKIFDIITSWFYYCEREIYVFKLKYYLYESFEYVILFDFFYIEKFFQKYIMVVNHKMNRYFNGNFYNTQKTNSIHTSNRVIILYLNMSLFFNLNRSSLTVNVLIFLLFYFNKIVMIFMFICWNMNYI